LAVLLLLYAANLAETRSNAQQMCHGLFRKHTTVIMEESPQSRNEHNAIQTHTSGYLYEDIACLNVLEHV
jgi:hypothetical protein